MTNRPHPFHGLWFRRPPVAAAILLLGSAFLYSASLLLPSTPTPTPTPTLPQGEPFLCSGDLSTGRWQRLSPRPPLYDSTCPFHRNAWNCLRNGRSGMDSIYSYVWHPDDCYGAPLPRIDPAAFLVRARGRRIGFVGDSLNENFLVAFLCALRGADGGARKWKRKGAWRGGYFPEFDVTVGYHRAVLLAKYVWQPVDHSALRENDGVKGIYRVDVDVPADDWANVTKFYDVLIFNTGHWWGLDKFPKETPLVFYQEGKPIVPPLGILDGLQVVVENMVLYIERAIPNRTLKLWRTQSPRHFYGGDWDRNGSCLFTEPLRKEELDSWFDPRNRGVNKEAREVNSVIERSVRGTSIELVNLTHLSEYRADAHPASWLGKKDAVAVWGQDCMHWCLPGVPDTWVDIVASRMMYYFLTLDTSLPIPPEQIN